MQIVIDITEEKFNMLKNEMYCGIYDAELYKAIENGTPLPKGHGRLIDADNFLKDNEAYTGWILNSSEWGGENAYKDALEDLINDAPIIIKAESEDE